MLGLKLNHVSKSGPGSPSNGVQPQRQAIAESNADFFSPVVQVHTRRKSNQTTEFLI